MATLWIGEQSELKDDQGGSELPLWAVPPTTSQTVTFTTAAQSAAFKGDTRILRLYASAAFHAEFGANPTATAASNRWAGTTEYFVRVQGGHKISVYDGSS